MQALEATDTTAPSGVWSIHCTSDGGMVGGKKWVGRGKRGREGGLSISPVVSKQSAEHLAVCQAAERTNAKSPLLPLALPVPSLYLSPSFLIVSTRVNPPAPEKHLQVGKGQEEHADLP